MPGCWWNLSHKSGFIPENSSITFQLKLENPFAPNKIDMRWWRNQNPCPLSLQSLGLEIPLLDLVIIEWVLVGRTGGTGFINAVESGATVGSGSPGGVGLSSTEMARSAIVIGSAVVMGAVVGDGYGVEGLSVGRKESYVARIIGSFWDKLEEGYGPRTKGRFVEWRIEWRKSILDNQDEEHEDEVD